MLHTAGIENAALFVVAIDNRDAAVEVVKYARRTYPKVRILARAFDRGHGYLLRQAGAHIVESETYHSALELGGIAMEELGRHPFEIQQQKNAYKFIEKENSDTLYQAWADDSEGERFDNNYRKLFMDLEHAIKKAIGRDRLEKHSLAERGWTPPPKEE